MKAEPAVDKVLSVEALHAAFVSANVYRAFVISRDGKRELSHPELLFPLESLLSQSPDWADHEAIFIGRDPRFETLFFAFVHDTRRGLAQGGLRFDEYSSVRALLSDGLRLSRGMTRKNALAGLWWGGGKGIIAKTQSITANPRLTNGSLQGDEREPRNELLRAYGRFVASLGGVYYTAEDIGTYTADMNAILSTNRFVTCIGKELGGSGNPSPLTAQGVIHAMEAGWEFLTGGRDLAGLTVAVQGVGNVGSALVEKLDHLGARLVLNDKDDARSREVAGKLKNARIVVEEDAIFDVEADIFAPCATGKVVNQTTIPRLKVKMVCGAANNILEEPADAQRLRERNILFIPDYLTNRTGIINCANEWWGHLLEDTEARVAEMFGDTRAVLLEADRDGITPTEAADRKADLEAATPHPLMGHRGRRLIDHLIKEKWHLTS